jgi:hypothetical protein
MGEQFKIEDVKYFTQRDNTDDPFNTCFNTSNAMAMDYCLTSIGKDKTAVGCNPSPKAQLEDYIYECIYDNVTGAWMQANVSRLGSWIWKYKRGVLYVVEEYIFNRLMNPLGFKATFYESISYAKVCETIKQNNLPGIIGGNFASVSPVGGHMNALLGYNSIGTPQFLTHDPFGKAFSRYADPNGADQQYPIRFFNIGKDNYNVILMSKI